MFELIIIRWIFWYMCRDKCNIKYDKIKNGEIKKREKEKIERPSLPKHGPSYQAANVPSTRQTFHRPPRTFQHKK